jgi:hypothetical protein
MGTNFYAAKDKSCHIGKRSAAGWYCWDCNISLCAQGSEGVHHTLQYPQIEILRQRYPDKDIDDRGWFLSCPECGKPRPEKASISSGAMGRELGFDRSPFGARTGVDTCSSFSWGIDPEGEVYKKLLKTRGKPIIDEYGRKYAIEEWLKMLEECPIRYVHSIGTEFS